MNAQNHQAGALQGVLLLLPITMAVMGLVVLVPVLPGVMAEFHAVHGVEYLVPLMLTLPALCVALLSPVAGAIVDFFGRRRTLIGALFGYAAVGILPLFLKSLTAIIASRFLLGTMEALVVISSTTLIGDYFHGKQREKWLAWQTAIASISSIFLAFLGGMLGSSALGWRGPFAAYGVSVFFAVCILLFTWEPERSEQPADEIAGPDAHIPWMAILPIAALAIFGGTMFFTMQIQVSTMLSEYYGMGEASQIGMFSAIAGLAVAIGTVLYQKFSAPRPVPTQLLFAFGLLGVSYATMRYAAAPGSFASTLVVNQIGCGMLLPALVVWAMGRLPFEVRGRGTGIFMSGWWLGQPLSTQAVAFLRSQLGGSLPATLQVLGGLCLVAAVLALFSRSRAGAPGGTVSLH